MDLGLGWILRHCSLHADLLWTPPTNNLWNTFFKIVFIGCQSYILYLMLVDYKPTHDPNQDTFKVEYLLGGAFVLGILLPPHWRYQVTEVGWRMVKGDVWRLWWHWASRKAD